MSTPSNTMTDTASMTSEKATSTRDDASSPVPAASSTTSATSPTATATETETETETTAPAPALDRTQVLPLLRLLATWGNTVTIVQHGGSVFEFKGPFPTGSEGRGFYNLSGPTPGFHGHLNLGNLNRVTFQDRQHAGRAAYAFVFENDAGEIVFKVFLGRDDEGQILLDQLDAFRQIRESLSVPSTDAT